MEHKPIAAYIWTCRLSLQLRLQGVAEWTLAYGSAVDKNIVLVLLLSLYGSTKYSSTKQQYSQRTGLAKVGQNRQTLWPFTYNFWFYNIHPLLHLTSSVLPNSMMCMAFSSKVMAHYLPVHPALLPQTRASLKCVINNLQINVCLFCVPYWS